MCRKISTKYLDLFTVQGQKMGQRYPGATIAPVIVMPFSGLCVGFIGETCSQLCPKVGGKQA